MASSEQSPDVGSLHYIVKFLFKADCILTTVRITLKDHQTDSDVVITNMTTLPEDRRGQGFGSKAITKILQWAADNHLREVRATQVAQYNESFWSKNGFTKDEEPNPCNDFVISPTQPIAPR